MPRALETELEDLVLVEPDVHGDDRGFTLETYRADAWRGLGIEPEFVQTNHSRSRQGTLRGLHYQTPPGQAKLVWCARGRIWDVAVDLRRRSSTFGKWEAHDLNDEGHLQLFIPAGFAHGYCVVSEVADVVYALSTPYDPATEAEIKWDDPEIGIDWPIENPMTSERDRAAPSFAEATRLISF
jgi:dTDP-4-dehydrorhamnose 3,5-epimerase